MEHIEFGRSIHLPKDKHDMFTTGILEWQIMGFGLSKFTGMDVPLANSTLKVNTNPVKNVLTVEVDNSEEAMVSIFDVTNKMVYQQLFIN